MEKFLVGRSVLEVSLTASVLIAGGGPCGLMLANELGQRSVSAVQVDEKPGVSLYDLFGFEWTLLQFDQAVSDAVQLPEGARALGADLKLVTLPRSVRDLYEADLALIRPDQVVAWRGSASQVGARALPGARTSAAPQLQSRGFPINNKNDNSGRRRQR